MYLSSWRVPNLKEAAAAALREADDAVASAGRRQHPDTEGLDEITTQWKHARQSFPQLVADIYTAKVKAMHAECVGTNTDAHALILADIKTQVSGMVRTWRARHAAMSTEHTKACAVVATLEEQSSSVATRLRRHSDSPLSAQQHAANVVSESASTQLAKLRHSQMQLVCDVNDTVQKTHIDLITGIVLACVRFCSVFKRDAERLMEAYASVRSRADSLAESGNPSRASKCAELTRSFAENVYEPLTRELVRYNIAPDTVRIAMEVYADTAPDGASLFDPYCVQRCSFAEETLTRLLKIAHSSGKTRTRDDELQAEALRFALLELDRLRNVTSDVRDEATRALTGDNVVKDLKCLQLKEAAINTQLSEAQNLVDKLSTCVKAAAELPPDPEETRRLTAIVRDVRNACKDVQESVENARRAPAVFRQMADDQCRESMYRLLQAGERAIGRAVEIVTGRSRDADVVAHRKQAAAATLGEDIVVVQGACAAHRPRSFSANDVTRYALHEENARVQDEIHSARMHREMVHAMQGVAAWVVAEGTRLSHLI
jgi:hypothetical protein